MVVRFSTCLHLLLYCRWHDAHLVHQHIKACVRNLQVIILCCCQWWVLALPFPIEDVGGERPERSCLLLGLLLCARSLSNHYEAWVCHHLFNKSGGWALHSLVMECRLQLRLKKRGGEDPRHKCCQSCKKGSSSMLASQARTGFLVQFLVHNHMWEGLLHDPQEVSLEGLLLLSGLLTC